VHALQPPEASRGGESSSQHEFSGPKGAAAVRILVPLGVPLSRPLTACQWPSKSGRGWPLWSRQVSTSLAPMHLSSICDASKTIKSCAEWYS
jgi:hypothetical protein